MNYRYIIVAFTVIFAITTVSFAQEKAEIQWKQFRGNDRNGSSSMQIANSWTENAPQLLWNKTIGEGFSEVLIASDKLYTMTSEMTDSVSGLEYMLALDAKTGETLWKTKVDSIFIDVDGFGNGPRSTPAIDDNYAYCFSSYGKLTAVALADGKINWSIDFVKDYESTLPRWAYSTSPIILDDCIIMEVGGSDSRGFASINKKDGKVNWIKGVATSYYSSPAIAEIDGKRNLIFANDSMLTSFDVDGNELWAFRMPLRFPTATPLFIAPNKVFVSSAGRAGGFLVEINGSEVKSVFTSATMKNHFSSSCYHNGYIYGFSNALLRCISAETGELKWSKIKLGKGTLVLVNDKLLVLSDKGLLKLVDTNPEAYTELGSIQTITGKSWTAPSLGNGHIYMRNLTQIASYKIK